MWSSFQIQIGNKGSEYKQWCHDMGNQGGACFTNLISGSQPGNSGASHGDYNNQSSPNWTGIIHETSWKNIKNYGIYVCFTQPVEPCSCETNILFFMRRGIQSLAARHVVPFRIKAEVLQVFRQEGKHHQTSKDNGTSVLENCTVWFAGCGDTIYVSDMWNCII